MAFRRTGIPGVDRVGRTHAKLPGSGQVGLGKSLLTRYSWQKLEPRPEMVEPHWTEQDYWRPFAGAHSG